MSFVNNLRRYFVLFAITIIAANSVNAQMLNLNASINQGCRPLEVTFTITSLGIDSLLWNFGDGTFYGTPAISDTVHTFYYGAGQIYNVNVFGKKVTGGWLSASEAITVDGASGTFSISNDSICPNTNVTFSSTDISSSYKWNFGDGNTATGTDVANTFTGTGTYNVSLILNTPTCGIDTIIKQVYVGNNVYPTVGYINVMDTIVCKGTQVSYYSSDYNLFSNITWFYGDGQWGANYGNYNYHTYAGLGTKNVTFVVGNLCGRYDTAYANVHVVDTINPQIGFFSVNDTLVCPTKEVLFYLPNYSDYTSFVWDFGDGNIGTIYDATNTHSYPVDGNYTITLIVFNDCGNSDTAYSIVRVSSLIIPSIGFMDVYDNINCPNEEITYYLSNFTDYMSMMWYFGDGDTTTNRFAYNYHKYDTTGNYLAIVEVYNECHNSDQKSKMVYIMDSLAPAPASYVVHDTVICPGDQVGFELYNFQDYDRFVWHYGDGNRGKNKLRFNYNTYYNLGTYTVSLVVSNKCNTSHLYVMKVHVVDTLSAKVGPYTISEPTSCPNQDIEFYLSDYTSYDHFAWYYGDGTSDTAYQEISTHSYSSTGVFQVKLVVYNHCGAADSVYKNVTITNTIPVQLGYSSVDDTIACPGDLVNFYLDSSANYDSIIWYFGDGDSSTVIQDFVFHTYLDTGTYDVALVAFNGCYNSDTALRRAHIIDTLNPLPVVYMVYDTTICPDDQVIFQVSNYFDFSKFTWHYGDGDTSTTSTYYNYHSYAALGIYYPMLVTENGCGFKDTSYATVNVVNSLAPTSGFSATRDSVCRLSDTIMFAPTYTTYPNFLWDFGDGNTSTDLYPFYAYSDTGAFVVTLVITNGCGVSDTATGNIYVYPEPIAEFTYGCVCGTDSLYFDDSSIGIITDWEWDFGDGTYKYNQYPSHTFKSHGAHKVCLTVTDGCGTVDSTCKYVKADCHLAVPKFGFTTDELTLFFTDSSLYAVDWLWDFGDGGNSPLQHPIHTYLYEGVYYVCIVVTNYCGLKDTLCDSISIYTGVEERIPVYSSFQVFPNPYGEYTTITYELKERDHVSLEVTNLLGKRVALLAKGVYEKGDYSYKFSAKEIGYPAGMYLVTLKIKDLAISKRLIELR